MPDPAKGEVVGSLKAQGRCLVICISFAVIAAGCGSDGSVESGSTSPSPSPEETVSAVAELVGTWERVTNCPEVVKILEEADLDPWIAESVVGNSFVPGVKKVSQLDDPSDPCKGSVSREHSHFFTEGGEFGSLDWRGERVDDGSYEIIDDHTFVVSKEFPAPVMFNYEITGDTIMFEPVVPDCAPDCFEAAWSVIVAYPGKAWRRVQ